MNNKILYGVLGVIILGALALTLMKPNTPITNTSTNNPTNEQSTDTVPTTSDMRVAGSAVLATDQRPGNSVTIAQVYLEAPGYVVIHEADGTILGSSALLQAGQSDKVVVTLSRASKENETLTAELHSEINGDTTFQEATDKPVQGQLVSGPIMGTFTISSSAAEDIEVTL